MARITSIAFATILFNFLAVALAKAIPQVSHDVIIVGGGPAGLSALSGLSRVKRKAIMFDSQEYRNAPTRNMHDVIGNDGTPPAVFRGLAREQISKYKTATMVNATVQSVTPVHDEGYFRVTADGKEYTGRSVILGTGLVDILPSTPGMTDAWGKGMYWCPWCDGYEHRDQPLGILGPLRDAYSSVIEVRHLNTDVVIYANGTENDEEKAVLNKKYPGWDKVLEAYNVTINNASITSIERLRNGSVANDPKEDLQFDQFRIHFADNSTAVRNALFLNAPTVQRSHIPSQLGLGMADKKIVVGSKFNTTLPGVYAIGDANNDGSTNVPHAMYSGKGAAVKIHVALAHEESAAAISKRGLEKGAWRSIGDDLEALWKRAQSV
ncbi:thioredoxin reductase [Aspergillus sclerotialis]|uniref:Thioredoxin reductase n=1 Tax=Aspergillus sclerotialis TaxID=2070753 RepID=A0A3A2ZGM0_9EURO|nr:thioredoxin reductase [Aspergillus sclerotialis]